MISMSRSGRSDASSILLLTIAVAGMVAAGLLAFAMSASGSPSEAIDTVGFEWEWKNEWKSATYNFQNPIDGTVVTLNETDKVVIITEAGIAAGWTVATPVPISP